MCYATFITSGLPVNRPQSVASGALQGGCSRDFSTGVPVTFHPITARIPVYSARSTVGPPETPEWP